MTLQSTRPQKGKQVDTGTSHLQTIQGDNNNAQSRKGKEVDTNTTPLETLQDNEGVTEEIPIQEISEKVHQLVSNVEILRHGMAATDACGTTLHAIINRIQLGIDELRPTVDKAGFMIDAIPLDDCDEGEDLEDGYTSDGSAGSDIPAVPETRQKLQLINQDDQGIQEDNSGPLSRSPPSQLRTNSRSASRSLQQPLHNQAGQSQATLAKNFLDMEGKMSAIELRSRQRRDKKILAAANAANRFIPRMTVEVSVEKKDVNQPPSTNMELRNSAKSSDAGLLIRSKRIRSTAYHKAKGNKRQRLS
ncbi:hypothetical protein BOTCAL_0008g00480 [Botryotinia calthae]|uniref:Uncharacterized protein n=1 Tax=Botryotinia calthae TaxID=38488 RepID=A0A4Y8DGT0_9HELO|nr:hypothetical protein BOTCAL_0008g00480 [Botryotinia calthae]